MNKNICLAISAIVMWFPCMSRAEDGEAAQAGGVLNAASETDAEPYYAKQWKVYIPRSLEPGERVRGALRFNFRSAADSPFYRDFAEKSGFALMPLFGDKEKMTHMLGVKKKGYLADLPYITTAHSRGGKRTWVVHTDNNNRPNTVAIVGHHSLTFFGIYDESPTPELWQNKLIGQRPTLIEPLERGDPRGDVPVWSITGSREGLRWIPQHAAYGAAEASEVGWKWTFAMSRGETHGQHHYESIKLQTLWLEDVVRLRMPERTVDDEQPVLRTIDETKGWVGYYRISMPSDPLDGGYTPWGIEEVAIYPYAEAPGRGVTKYDNGDIGGYCWLPSEEFAKAWLAFHRTGTVDGDASPRIVNKAWFTLEDLATHIGWNTLQRRPGSYLNVINIPGYQGDMDQVKWAAVSPLPAWLELQSNGAFKTQDPKPGTYQFRVRAAYGEQSWEEVFTIGVRSDWNDGHLAFSAKPVADAVNAEAPVEIKWNSSLPLGIMEIFSSLDGQVDCKFDDLGDHGTVLIPRLSAGEHLITLRVYSSAPDTCRQAESFFVRVAEPSPVEIAPEKVQNVNQPCWCLNPYPKEKTQDEP